MLIDLMAGEKVCGCAMLVLRIDGLTAQLWERGAGGSQDNADHQPPFTSLRGPTPDRLQSERLLLARQKRDHHPFNAPYLSRLLNMVL